MRDPYPVMRSDVFTGINYYDPNFTLWIESNLLDDFFLRRAFVKESRSDDTKHRRQYYRCEIALHELSFTLWQ